MRQAYRILPVYTGDVSGVCSALYELGGMVVMHDPSGCNSTYNTHDEIRWYDRDSLIFLSGLCEPDAVLGNDDKLIGDVVRAAAQYHPAFIALCYSPIPYLTGTDFAGICRCIENKTGIPAFYIPTNGMHDYVSGAGMALEKLALCLFGGGREERQVPSSVRPPSKERTKVNILGMTPLDYAAEGSCGSLKRILEQAGLKVQSVWAMESPLQDLKKAGEADVNLVVSAAGLRTALFLQSRFGTPWTAGAPVGAAAECVLSSLYDAAAGGACGPAYGRKNAFAGNLREGEGSGTALIIGEPVLSCSIAAGLEAEGTRTLVIAATEESEALVRDGDLICRGEEEIEDALSRLAAPGCRVIADPLYRYVCPDHVLFESFPQLSFSGRLYRSGFINPFRHEFGKGGTVHGAQ